ncbi:FlgO family outer membrane protein [uncultured Alteromonas sp.]|jgi:TolB-like protein|uniref:FlgO family outer membrane protein n=1 Tax=uncultured Alteromonas sp. TaxID=179113 RepID=UPI0025D8D840|nr:FlgO family outer membrane protein [uncultured Alteromonas sp.]
MKHHTILSGLALSATLLAGCCATDHAQTQPPHQHSASSDAYAAVPGLPMTTVKTEQTQSPQSHQLAQFRPHQDRLQPVDPYIPRAAPVSGWAPPAHTYRPVFTHKLLGDYAEQMTMKLIENIRYVSTNTPVAVTSLVDLDSSLAHTNILGNQLAESFITELQEFGIPVVDYKTTGVIHVGGSGDFVFSRNLGELERNPYIKYILSGTMTYNDRGIILNIRMVDINSKVVVASSKGFIPQFVVDSLYPRNYVDGIVLDTTS